MKVLIIGQGGREHALVKAFCHSPSITEVHALPGNDGMRSEAICHPQLTWQDTDKIIELCLRSEITFVFIGPEDPLVNGLSDRLRERGILVVGPSQEAAQLEGSKIFAKEFMNEAQVPTSPHRVVHNVSEVMDAADFFIAPYVLKVDGLAAGKGVYICKTKQELQSAANEIFVDKIFGPAGSVALLEQFLPGWELSYLVVTNGQQHLALPLAQDHKRLSDDDQGPNTGGMGTVAPLNIDFELRNQIESSIINPVIKLLDEKNYTYRGVLYFGLMITQNGPQLLEFNCRFGDPEAQVILPLIENDLGEYFKHVAEGNLPGLRSKNICASCVILAAENYPQAPVKGSPIEGDPLAQTNSSYFIHAGTKLAEGQWQTNGGRVLGAVGLGSTLGEALQQAYSLSQQVTWQGMQKRSDIGKKLL